MKHKRRIGLFHRRLYLILVAALAVVCAETKILKAESTPTQAGLIELLPKVQKNTAIAMWKNQLVYGVYQSTAKGGHLLRFVNPATDKIVSSIKNMPHSETSLTVSNGKLYVFGIKPPGNRWESHIAEVTRSGLNALTMHTGEQLLDQIFIDDGEFFGLNIGNRSVSKFTRSWLGWWSWDAKIGTFSQPAKLLFDGERVYVLEGNSFGLGDERVSYFDRNDFLPKRKTMTSVNSQNKDGPIRDMVLWNNFLIAGGEGKMVEVDLDTQETVTVQTSEHEAEKQRIHFKLKTTEKCLISIDPFNKELSFYDYDLNEVDTWDLSSAKEQFDFPQNFVVDIRHKKVFVKSSKPCLLCDKSAGSVYAFTAPESPAAQTCF